MMDTMRQLMFYLLIVVCLLPVMALAGERSEQCSLYQRPDGECFLCRGRYAQFLIILIAATALISHANAKESCSRVINKAMVSKLCPNPNVRCLVRDNPEFYKETDPALYNRITKCKR
jgi:hypothetical protein